MSITNRWTIDKKQVFTLCSKSDDKETVMINGLFIYRVMNLYEQGYEHSAL